MAYRTRIRYSAEQKAEMWDRWQRGESLKSIGRAFDRGLPQSMDSYRRAVVFVLPLDDDPD